MSFMHLPRAYKCRCPASAQKHVKTLAAVAHSVPMHSQGQHRDAQRANIFSLGAIGDELMGLLAPSAHRMDCQESHRYGVSHFLT